MLLRGGKRFGFEFKCSDAPRTTKSMHIVTADLDPRTPLRRPSGELEYPLADRMTALPLGRVAELALR